MTSSQKLPGLNKTGLLFFIFILLTAVSILKTLGREWWCKCGEPFLWASDIWSTHTSQHFLDPYSFSHFLHGIVFFWSLRLLLKRASPGLLFLLSIAIESCWEIAENSPFIIERYRAGTIALDYFGDSIINSLADIGCAALGFMFAASVRFRAALAVFVLIELILLVLIRDNLTLNVLMLIYPIDGIKQWQMP